LFFLANHTAERIIIGYRHHTVVNQSVMLLIVALRVGV